MMLAVIVLCLEIAFVVTTRYEQPVAKSTWPQRCNKHAHALNDCNWCWCNEKQVFACHARVCSTVDMFGHFNDAIRDIKVGMEGRGVWRSNTTACDPGVQYQRHNLLCICDQDGNWPSAVCRDTFRVLHAVEFVGKHNKAKRCVATRLYVVGCNVCYCPSTGRIDLELCTKRNCTEDDPVLHEKKVKQPKDTKNQEYYAECSHGQEYEIGCKKCTCISNNRLLCDENDDCTEEKNARATEGLHYCSSTKPGQIFNMDCNLCFCDKRHVIYCTTKQCIDGPSKYYVAPNLFRTSNLIAVAAPHDDLDCTPGTKYIKGCNLCYCSRTEDGSKVYSCTIKTCDDDNSKTALDNIKAGCVKSEVYKLNCLICRCDVVDEIKRETCQLDPKCTGDKALKEARSDDLKSLRGYCEPYHDYHKDCNTCRCLGDGKVVECTPDVCNENEKKPISVDIVPVSQNDAEPCPKNHMYKVDCNVCFCLSSGNVLCTTIDCNKEG